MNVEKYKSFLRIKFISSVILYKKEFLGYVTLLFKL